MPHHLIDVLVGAAAALAVPATAAGITHHATLTRDVAETVEIRTIVFDFPAPGEFLVKGVPAASPVSPGQGQHLSHHETAGRRRDVRSVRRG